MDGDLVELGEACRRARVKIAVGVVLDDQGKPVSNFMVSVESFVPSDKEMDRLGGLAQSDRNPNGVWKCNLFGGNALYVAGFEPPYYGNRGKGEYPNANQFYTFSDVPYGFGFGSRFCGMASCTRSSKLPRMALATPTLFAPNLPRI